MKTKKHSGLSHAAILFWFLLGLALSTMAIQFRLSGNINLKKFYDVGKKYIVPVQCFLTSYPGCEYQSNGRYLVTEQKAVLTFYSDLEKNKHWNYIYLNIRDMNREKLTVDVIETNNLGEQVSVNTARLEEGLNEIQVSPDPSNCIMLQITDQAGASFRIQSMQFRVRRSYYGTAKVIKMLLVCMAVYAVFTGMLYHFFLWKVPWKRIYLLSDGLILFYTKLTEKLMAWGNKIEKSKAQIVRRTGFFIMIFLMLYTENYGAYNHKSYYYIYLFLNCIILFIISLVSMEKKCQTVNWTNPIVLSWVCYSILACISDIIVPKTQMMTGVMMLTIFGLLYFTISRMEHPIVVLYDFMHSVKMSYVVTTAFCLMCRPVAGRYIGCTVSPYSYALYLGIVIAVFFGELERWFLEKIKVKYLILHLTGLISALYFEWLTQSRNGILAVFVCGSIFLFRIFQMKKAPDYGRKIIYAIVSCAILTIPVLWCQDWCVRNLPAKLGTTVHFSNDTILIGKKGQNNPDHIPLKFQDKSEPELFQRDVVYAQETGFTLENQRVFRWGSSLDVLSSGRITIYKEYIALMNLWGHKKDPYISNTKMRAHNAILQTGYRYGIFAMIPYVIMLIYAGYYSVCYLRTNRTKEKSYAVFPLCAFSVCLVTMTFDNVERNFRYLPWFTFYLLVGFLSNRQNKDKTQTHVQ